jgi:predicted RNA-binding Zn ribbon-like protein
MDANSEAGSGPLTLDFLFVGGNLAINLVNTWRKRRVPGSRQSLRFDLFWDLSRVELWWRMACARHGLHGYGGYAWSEESISLLLGLRTELRSLFEAMIGKREDLPPVPMLNRILERGSFVVGTEGSTVRREYLSREGERDALLEIALGAAEFLATVDRTRFHDCRNDQCLALFYDQTKSGTRRWCRAECMNRARARENYRKRKEEA